MSLAMNLKKTIIACIAGILIAGAAQAQSFAKVKAAISIASAKEVAALFENSVEMSLDGKNTHYSKSQAEFVLRDFFQDNPVKSFSIIHKGNSEGGLTYAIGKYATNAGSYRVLIRMRNNKIYNLSFTKE